MNFPKMVLISQEFPRPQLDDIPKTVLEELNKLSFQDKLKPGSTIGITVGSRGIQNICTIIKTTVSHLKSLDFKPVLIAAMGSHGNGTSKGQQEVLDSLGITEEAMGAPILTSDDCVTVGETGDGLTAYVVKPALEVDGIVVINRIKTHTSFKGRVESGLIKKIVVGLGGPKGAGQFHNYGSSFLPKLLIDIGTLLLEKLSIVGGLAIIENGFEETCVIKGIEPEDLISEEEKLLLYSKELMPAIPTKELDLLVVQEMGKNYSGTGIDTNIIGRVRIEGDPDPEYPAIKRIAVCDLSEASHGNATGIGLADFTTEKIVNKMDREATYLNCLTSTFVIRSAIPMYFATEKEMIEKALFSLRGVPLEQQKVIITPNTLHLTKLYVSEALLPELKKLNSVKILGEPQDMIFDEQGNLNLPSLSSH